jgi:RNA polymerase sigma-70 factor (ECF subfamily)
LGILSGSEAFEPVIQMTERAMAANTKSETEAARDLTEEFRAVLPRLQGYARSLTRKVDTAEDLVQDTLLRAWASQNQFVPGTNFRAWIFTIMRHRFLDTCRRNRALLLPIDDLIDHPRLSLTPEQDAKLELEEVAHAYWRLSPNHREILTLVGALGLEYEEAAEVIGCKTGTVRSRLSRARDELQKQLDQGEGTLARPRKAPRQLQVKDFLAELDRGL